MSLDSAKHLIKSRKAAKRRTIARKELRTLDDLITAIVQRQDLPDHLKAMLRALTAHICMSLEKSPQAIAMAELVNLRPHLTAYLRQRSLRPKSVQSYANYLRILLRLAEQFGWRRYSPEVEKAWGLILACVSQRRKGATTIVRYAIRENKTPDNFTDADLERWTMEQHCGGRTWVYTQKAKTAFQRSLMRAGLTTLLPNLTFPAPSNTYAVPPSQVEEPLRSQLATLRQWKTADFIVDRPRSAKQRPITAMSSDAIVRRILGYARTVLKKQIDTLTELLSKEIVCRYIEWCINERKLCVLTVRTCLATIAGLVKHPLFGDATFGWVKDLMAGLPADVEGRILQRKARKWVDYDELDAIPDQILETARQSSEPNIRAMHVRDALMLFWLLVLPWRQRNLRECRIRGSNPNLFKDEIPPLSLLAKPKWVEERLRSDPHEKFWQFRFGPKETKNGHQVHAFLPKQLIAPLEDYLAHHRPCLVKGVDPGTLFLNNWGRRYSASRIIITIAQLVARYTGRWVTPHLFRDIFAVKYLEEHPEDYLTLSKILWHRNVGVTLNAYGARFDESHGARRVEEWLEVRQKRQQAA